MEFRILGPLEVAHEDVPLQVRGSRQRTVLALLLLEAERIVPVDRLIDGVWGKEPPATSRSQIQICISSLRHQLSAAGLITTRPPGYRLRTGEHALDLADFETRVADGRRSAAEGRLRQAAGAFRTALALWRGPALHGIGSRLVRGGVAQLDEQRLALHEECLELELAAGEHQRLVGELAALAAAHPLRERPRALLMTALYRSGRQAEALTEYRRTRETFIEELGIEPGEGLRRLHHAILTGDPRLIQGPDGGPAERATVAQRHAPTRVPRLLPADVADFTGRRATVAALLERPAGGSGEQGAGEPGPERGTEPPTGPTAVPVTVVTGRAGVGKSTLAVHVAHRLAARYPDGQLFASLSGTGGPVGPGDVLGRFLRALGVAEAEIPAGTEERAEMYRDRLAGRRVLVVLDGAGTQQQVAALLPGTAACRVLITSRHRLTGLPAARRVELGPFDRADALEFLARIAGRRRVEGQQAQAAQLCAACDDLPLALRGAAARLVARPHWTVADLNRRLLECARPLDELSRSGTDVRAAVATAYDSRTPGARRLLRLLAVPQAASFASWAGGPLLRTDPLTSQDLLEELAESYLLEVDIDPVSGAARYRLPGLVRAFARERLAVEETAGAHRAALERYLGALLFLLDEAYRRGGHDRAPESGSGGAGVTRWALPARWVGQILADPGDWYGRERPWLLLAVRQAADAGLLPHARALADAVVAVWGQWRAAPGWGGADGTGDGGAPRTSRAGGRAVLVAVAGAGGWAVGPGTAEAGDEIEALIALAGAYRHRGEHGQARALLAAARRAAGNAPPEAVTRLTVALAEEGARPAPPEPARLLLPKVPAVP
ncbi:BTAD domain-containing putative transcriptional regulator [Streptomyces xiamenensis]|uniref:Transcriptional regulator, SARP family n=1 Tax=Streptomyces xiamenensis TaxID=408015 RepID=A0A0F7CQJ8_9ACTN|nr:BTAD domain-containing putative transcriptional regulator [Streptomyces xiamenensis]AKG46536.1 transcriptional regulator, SARP family [Streptomyces xiamenensis]